LFTALFRMPYGPCHAAYPKRVQMRDLIKRVKLLYGTQLVQCGLTCRFGRVGQGGVESLLLWQTSNLGRAPVIIGRGGQFVLPPSQSSQIAQRLSRSTTSSSFPGPLRRTTSVMLSVLIVLRQLWQRPRALK